MKDDAIRDVLFKGVFTRMVVSNASPDFFLKIVTAQKHHTHRLVITFNHLATTRLCLYLNFLHNIFLIFRTLPTIEQ